MRSSGGAYFAGLDHVRGLAALLVVVWHFSHRYDGYPVPFHQAPWLGPLDEGHLGVAVFMTLSGYLFAKLIGDRDIRFWPFIWNRAIRLLPLLSLVLLYIGFLVRDKMAYLQDVAFGLLLPHLPNGGWSITTEVHFYLLLPLLLAFRRKPLIALGLISTFLLFRLFVVARGWEIQGLAYQTIIGRIDQFALGMMAFYIRDRISGAMALAALAALWLFYAWFDASGGYYDFPHRYIWIILPTIEAATLATMIAWYDRNPLQGRWTWILEQAGKYSYSIYLLHFFFVGTAARLVDQHIMPIPTLILALPWAILFFGFMMLIGSISWKLVEQPALRFRKSYIAAPAPAATQPVAQQSS